jgi:FMN-dependent NADH-azoreductase
MTSKTHILRLDASANPGDSVSRKLGDRLIEGLDTNYNEIVLNHRDLTRGIPFVDSEWIAANFTSFEERDYDQHKRLALSDELIAELKKADHIVVTTPMYNFSIPSSLKAWIDQVCRAGITFRYTPDGPVGLLKNKRVDVVIATGGVPLGSPVDFVSGYLAQVFRFLGIDNVNIVGADQMNVDAESSYSKALDQIAQISVLSTVAA